MRGRYSRRNVNHERTPSATGYTVEIETSVGTKHRLHIWPTTTDARIAMVLLVTNGRAVSTWFARYTPATDDAIAMWKYYQTFRAVGPMLGGQTIGGGA